MDEGCSVSLVHEIWKFTLHPNAVGVPLPRGAKIIAVAEQKSSLCVWADVIPAGTPWVTRLFVVQGTGQPFTHDLPHIGTVVMTDGLVWHIFDGGETL